MKTGGWSDDTMKGKEGGMQEEGEIEDKGNEQGGKKRPPEPFYFSILTSSLPLLFFHLYHSSLLPFSRSVSPFVHAL